MKTLGLILSVFFFGYTFDTYQTNESMYRDSDKNLRGNEVASSSPEQQPSKNYKINITGGTTLVKELPVFLGTKVPKLQVIGDKPAIKKYLHSHFSLENPECSNLLSGPDELFQDFESTYGLEVVSPNSVPPSLVPPSGILVLFDDAGEFLKTYSGGKDNCEFSQELCSDNSGEVTFSYSVNCRGFGIGVATTGAITLEAGPVSIEIK